MLRTRQCLATAVAPLFSLQVVVPTAKLNITKDSLLTSARAFDDCFKECNIRVEREAEGDFSGALYWGAPGERVGHVDVFAKSRSPLPPSIVDRCVKYAMFSEKLKEPIIAAQSTVYLNFKNDVQLHPLEVYSRLSTLSGVLVDHFGAVGVLNANAHNSAPARLFTRAFIQQKQANGSAMDFFRTLPLTTLYCGFVRYSLPTEGDVLGFRTYGAELLGLPNFTAYAPQEFSDVVYSVFNAFWEFGLVKQQTFQEGQVIQMTSEERTAIALRALKVTEGQPPPPPGSIFVLEPVHGWPALRPES